MGFCVTTITGNNIVPMATAVWNRRHNSLFFSLNICILQGLVLS